MSVVLPAPIVQFTSLRQFWSGRWNAFRAQRRFGASRGRKKRRFRGENGNNRRQEIRSRDIVSETGPAYFRWSEQMPSGQQSITYLLSGRLISHRGESSAKCRARQCMCQAPSCNCAVRDHRDFRPAFNHLPAPKAGVLSWSAFLKWGCIRNDRRITAAMEYC